MALRGIIFDADGTLIDSFRHHYHFLKDAAARYGGTEPFPPFDDEFRARYNRAVASGQMPGVLRLAGITDESVYPKIHKLYDEHHERVPPAPFLGIPAALESISTHAQARDIRLAINTAKRTRHLRPSLGGIAKHFDEFVGYEDLEAAALRGPSVSYLASPRMPAHTVQRRARALGKPNPYSARLALERLGAAPNEAVAFEDSAVGVAAYVGAGVPVYGVAWGFEDAASLRRAGALAVLERPSELPFVIEDLL